MSWGLQNLPFFDSQHFTLAEKLQRWIEANRDILGQHPESNFGPYAKEMLGSLSAAGFLDYVLPKASGADVAPPDVRSICIIREALTYESFLADNMFVMQGLGTAPLWQHHDHAMRDAVIEATRQGKRIAAIALTEPDAGSDLASAQTTADLDGDSYVLNGEKCWITNAGIADQYIVVARTGEAPGARGLSAFMVDADTPGLTITPDVPMIAPHPLGSLKFENCRIPANNILGGAGTGFKAAMATFDVFRPSVGAAAVGAARRAMDETIARVKSRRMFGKTMSEMDTVQAKIADMTVETEAAALMVYRAAWASDVLGGRVSRESAMAKLMATEAAGRVIDSAVQLFGGLGVARGSVVEQLYRDIRPTRIYEGASEVQKVVIARATLR
ncbi:acyl-CoA dehydrogenase family protein [Novosphingobium colocasiae]|uniref:Medium-chain specific acyl-CoA dehydrogenase, mitochondrial n=1 Tax=Novosphingobium colocasiae TaxID=1256513 RepID=A0A918PMR9_9SPHN|nr:acyl-CoA dehydrogenase [Novosphingobium colocasiae]GGZ16185.1 acyl-CoA dehydrogenase [Novosphingobium colocasiae]